LTLFKLHFGLLTLKAYIKGDRAQPQARAILAAVLVLAPVPGGFIAFDLTARYPR
jgi:hypothetical protein